MNKIEIEKKIEELRKQWKLAKRQDQRLIEVRAHLLKRALEKLEENDPVLLAEKVFGVKAH